MSRVFLSLAVATWAFGLGGCGGRSNAPTYAGDDHERLAKLVVDLSDVSGAQLANRFAKGAAPNRAQAPQFRLYLFDLAGPPTVSGNEAKATVKFLTSADQADRGEKEWSFVKEGDAWKIKAAPLP